jgi:hypothetical protein
MSSYSPYTTGPKRRPSSLWCCGGHLLFILNFGDSMLHYSQSGIFKVKIETLCMGTRIRHFPGMRSLLTLKESTCFSK